MTLAAAMWHFNLVVTLAADGHYQRLRQDLSRSGEFHRTEFLGVILGFVEKFRIFKLEGPHARRDENKR